MSEWRHLKVCPSLPSSCLFLFSFSPLVLFSSCLLLFFSSYPSPPLASSFPLPPYFFSHLLLFSFLPLPFFSCFPLLLFPSSFLFSPSRLDNNQLTGELPSFHHMPHLTVPYSLHLDNNYFTATPDHSNTLMLCLFNHNYLHGNTTDCGGWQKQRRASECRAFCGAQPLTPPCSGHGVCSFETDPSLDMAACDDNEDDDKPSPPYCEPLGHCDCDEGYTPGTAAGTCISHGMPGAEHCSGGGGSVCSPLASTPAAAAASTGGATAAGLQTAAVAEAPKESTPHTLLLFKECPCCPASCHGCGDHSLAPLL
ncbi:unnamed protein product [Closterium sp. NIES-64]|nr:unnamed protein product [Closterium sp. NIES-64]